MELTLSKQRLFTLVFVLLLFSASFTASAQGDSLAKEEKNWVVRPSISAGVGMLNYQGDFIPLPGSFNPFQNKLGWHVGAAQPVTDFLDLNFYMMFGRVGLNERSLARNLNFESRLTSGGLALSYNFDHLLNEDRYLEPFVSVGFEAFEFLTKTDLYDSFGNQYYYWSDGTIRNLAETEANLETAREITRDYVYESDVRLLNQDGFGDYSQRSFAIPISAGFNLLMNDKMSLKMGFEYHYTFTDLIDGITEESRGIRRGNSGTDKFMYTYAQLSYDLTPVPKVEEPEGAGEDSEDSDLDSIPDFADNCPNTPLGIEVDDKGCPLDTDNDGVFDYLDQELNTPEGSIVDTNGVALTDELIEQLYLEYTDETGKYSQYTNESYSIETAERKTIRRKAVYSVKIGEFEGAIDDSLANVLLSMPDVTTRTTADGRTVIEAGSFDNLPEAIKRRVDIESAGLATTEVTETNKSGETSRVTNVEQDVVNREITGMNVEEAIQKNKALPPPKKIITNKSDYTLNRPIDERSVTKAEDTQFGSQTVYRVQIGAFANKLSDDVFEGINDLLVITTSDGLTRYYVGSFTSYSQAASRKIDMLQRGFSGAYVAPFKGGQRVSLQSTGSVTPAKNVVPLNNDASASDNFGKVKFLIQIGAYQNQIPADVLDKMMDLGRIEQNEEGDGTVKYFTGNFDTYEEAKALKEQLSVNGFEGAFVVAKFNDKFISANEGIQLLK